MRRRATLALLGLVTALAPVGAQGQERRYPLASTEGLRAQNTTVDAVTFKGERAVRVSVSPDAARRATSAAALADMETLVHIEGLDFGNGIIELEVASAPAEGASAGARGFAGIAFRVLPPPNASTTETYDAFYLRPTNGRAEDQERRNHAVQYISHPAWTWSRLRQETPSRYEAYVDLVPDTWTKVRIEVRGDRARLFVHDQPQPVLIINDVKTGATAKGGIALWIGPGTVAHFRELRVRPL